jgi:hypothetical protein
MMHGTKRYRLLSHITFLGLMAFLAGCGADLKDATTIATTGQTLSNQAANSLSTSSDNLNSFVESQYFGYGLTAPKTASGTALPSLPTNVTPIPPVDPTMLNSINVIKQDLAQRVVLLNKLNSLYVSYGNLAKYDASAEVQSASADVVSSVNALDKSLEPDSTSPAISTSDSNLISASAGAIASAIQQHELVQGSYTIRLVLEKIIPVLQKEQDVYTLNASHILLQQIAVTQDLWSMGLGSPDTILQTQLGAYGITYDPKQYPALDASIRARIANAVDQDLSYQESRASQLMSSTIGATIQAMQDLDNSQKQFENGEPVTIQSVQTDIQTLQTFVQLLQSVTSSAKTTGASSK